MSRETKGDHRALKGLGRGAIVAAFLLALTGCGPSLNYAYMAKDSSGNEKTTKFLTLGDAIYCVMELVGGDDETKLAFGLSGPSEFSLSDNDLYPRPDPSKQGPVKISIQLFQVDLMGNHVDKGPWPVGAYTMDILIDDEVTETLDFEVVP